MSGARRRLLLTADAIGGVWPYALDLARALVPHGVETLLALLGPPPSQAQRLEARAIPGLTLVETDAPLDWLAEDGAAVRHAGRRIAELARHAGVDLIQLNQPSLAAVADFPAAVIAVAHSCLATWWQAVERGSLPADFAWRVSLHGEGLAAAARVVCPSAAFAEATRAAYGLPVDPYAIHNGRASPVPAPAAIHDFAFTAGRLWDRGKDVATLDRAAARLAIPVKVAGALVGPHGERASFDHLHTLGQVDAQRLARCLAARPVFVSTARYEPFGLAVLEAAAAGCALVLADIPTFRELWEGAASFVAPGDDVGFAAAIEALIGDTHLRLVRGDAARRAAGRFTPAAMAAGMAALYETMVPEALGRRAVA